VADGGVVVVGSANIDQIFRVVAIPAPGETVLSTGFSTALGGKGQNQAVASARSGAPTTFVAALGTDAFATEVRTGLDADGIDGSLLRTVAAPTGTALIAVDDSGENTIIVEPGANGSLTELTEGDAAAIAAASVLVLQLEIPLQTVLAAARIARGPGTTTVLNAAPIRDLPEELLADIDVLVVNEHEAAHLAPDGDAGTLAPVVIVTLGAQGAVLHRRGLPDRHERAPRVTAVDATGAGDTFCGALAAALAGRTPIEEAVRFAVTAASLSVQTAGAVPSIPLRAAIDVAIEQQVFITKW
jgi:ribokinase